MGIRPPDPPATGPCRNLIQKAWPRSHEPSAQHIESPPPHRRARITDGPTDPAALDVTPPPEATVQKIEIPGSFGPGQKGADPSRTRAALTPDEGQKGLSFPLAAPATAGGLTRTKLCRPDADGVVVATYGTGLGSIVVYELRAVPTSGSGSGRDGWSLPTVSIAGASGNELSTPLGSVLLLNRSGVSCTLAGSVTGGSIESAAKDVLG